MYFLFSGEGPSDCGSTPLVDRISMGDDFQVGPMVCIASRLIEEHDGYSPLHSHCCALACRPALRKAIGGPSYGKNSLRFRGIGRDAETLDLRRSAGALAQLAKEWAAELGDEVVAILFRDSDPNSETRASERMWESQQNEVLEGFAEKSFGQGVPMIPRPTSESWLICALKERPYQDCRRLEERSKSFKAKRPLKQQLQELIGERPTRELLCNLIEDGCINPVRIDMPSFNAFRARLLEVARITPER